MSKVIRNETKVLVVMLGEVELSQRFTEGILPQVNLKQ
ncbi:MAG: hypothetical protein H6Q68_3639 [Firmicutes bacterium]|nr:hypothetical protein [Bacillota bacterium]